METTQENISLLNTQALDHLTEQFYQCVSFDQERYPNFDTMQDLFYGAGKLINNNFDNPIDFTAQSFSQAMMQQIESGNVNFYAQQEISDITEFFGKVAQRISVYEYSNVKSVRQKWKRGVNYIQFIFTEDKWLITSMVWNDEKEDLKVPAIYMI
ncbi:MAG TPA: hypothetical protein VNI52_04575 [Sphingobacteriaceae bacterium]|nr:hypothetical protein [Sphingobacteriaceae bacterium]